MTLLSAIQETLGRDTDGRTRHVRRRRDSARTPRRNRPTMGWLQGSERLEDRCLLSGSANLDQWANSPSNSWQNGNLNAQNSSYAEGNVVPFRVILGNLSAGVHELDLNFQSLNSGLHAYDYITTYNTTVPNPPANPLLGTSVPNAPTTAPIQQDPTLISKGLPATAGVVTAFNATMTSVNYVSTSSGPNQTTFYAIHFTTTAAQTQAVIAWGGHISSQLNWGFGNSASSINGSPYHMAVSTLDGASTGSQDRSIKASAVASGFIVVNKVTQPNPADPTLFPFIVTVPPPNTAPSDFSLSGGGSKILGPFFGGSGFGVSETQQPGWNLVSAIASNGTGTLSGTSLSNITVPQGNEVSVTFTNHFTFNPKVVTTASPAITLGDMAPPTLTDSALLSNGFNPTGTLTFTLTGPGGTAVDTEMVSVNGNGTYTTPKGYTLPTTSSVVGTYTWSVAYSGDPNNTPAKDQGGTAEQTSAGPATPKLVTTASPAITLSDIAPPTLTDSAVLSGGYAPLGTLTFTLTGPGGTAVDTEMVSVNGNGTYTTPKGYTLPTGASAVGTYTWSVSYADSLSPPNNLTAKDQGGAAEQTVVSPANPKIVTTASPAITLGDITPPTLTDSAVLSGGYAPLGTLTFTLTGPGGTAVDTEMVSVNGNGTYTTPKGYTLPTGASAVGTYTWSVTYADSLSPPNNLAAKDQGGAAEQTVVSPATPKLVTTASPAITLGDITPPTLTDSAVLSGGYAPLGTLTFTLTGPGGTAVDTEMVSVNGNSTYTTPKGYTLPTGASAVGTYTWSVSYADSLSPPNNLAAKDQGGAAEQTVVSPANPRIVTQASETAGGVVGSAVLSDTAILSGGYFPTGNISFTLTQPDGTVLQMGSVPVNGDGTYSSPKTQVATQAGTYSWSATYTDNLSPPNNLSAKDNGVNESLATQFRAQIAPTGTTAAQFANGTSTTLSTISASNDGTGHIAQSVNPGVFFVFSFVSAPKAGSFTITVGESFPNPPSAFLIAGTSTGNLALYDATGTNVIAGGTDLGNGTASFTATATTAGQVFIVLVKYDSKSIAGATLPNAPSFTYTWTTQVTQNSTTQTQSKAGVTLVNTSFTAGPVSPLLSGQMGALDGSVVGMVSPTSGTSLSATAIPVSAPDPSPVVVSVDAIDLVLADPASLLLTGKKQVSLFLVV